MSLFTSERLLYNCGFNRSLQHPNSNYREEHVENETATEDLVHRRAESPDLGSLASENRHRQNLRSRS